MTNQKQKLSVLASISKRGLSDKKYIVTVPAGDCIV
jgi:hypothetical protein